MPEKHSLFVNSIEYLRYSLQIYYLLTTLGLRLLKNLPLCRHTGVTNLYFLCTFYNRYMTIHIDETSELLIYFWLV